MFEDTYLSSLKNTFTAYSRATTLQLLSQLYDNCTRISSRDLDENDKKPREPYNPNKPLERLCSRLKNCVDYASAAGKPITEVQVVRIYYGLVTEMGKFQEDCQIWRAKSEPEKTWTTFQAHFIEAQADLHERQQTSPSRGVQHRINSQGHVNVHGV